VLTAKNYPLQTLSAKGFAGAVKIQACILQKAGQQFTKSRRAFLEKYACNFVGREKKLVMYQT